MVLNQLIRLVIGKPPSPRDLIPPAPKGYTSDTSVYGQPPAAARDDIRALRAARCANTESDAYRLMRRYPGKSIEWIIKKHKPRRRAKRTRALTVAMLLFFGVATPAAAQPPAAPCAKVVTSWVNVRSAPNTDSQILGVVRRGYTFDPTGITPDRRWFALEYQGQTAYIRAMPSYISTTCYIPPIGAVATPAAAPGPNILISASAINPPLPAPGQAFTLSLTLRNDGPDAGAFAVALTMGDLFLHKTVARLASGDSGVVDFELTQPVTGRHTLEVLIDPESALGPPGPRSKQTISYSIDRPYTAQGGITIPAAANLDLWGGRPDLSWGIDGLTALDGGGLAVWELGLSEVHHDALAALTPAALIPPDQIQVGTLIAVRLSERNWGLLRISEITPDGIRIQYFVYG